MWPKCLWLEANVLFVAQFRKSLEEVNMFNHEAV